MVVGRAAYADDYAAALGREFEGVRDVVVDNLFDLAAVDENLPARVGRLDGEVDALLPRKVAEGVADVRHVAGYVGALKVERQHFVLNLAELEQLVNQAREVLRVAHEDVDVGLGLVREAARLVGERLHGAADERERRAELVRYVGEEAQLVVGQGVLHAYVGAQRVDLGHNHQRRSQQQQEDQRVDHHGQRRPPPRRPDGDADRRGAFGAVGGVADAEGVGARGQLLVGGHVVGRGGAPVRVEALEDVAVFVPWRVGQIERCERDAERVFGIAQADARGARHRQAGRGRVGRVAVHRRAVHRQPGQHGRGHPFGLIHVFGVELHYAVERAEDEVAVAAADAGVLAEIVAVEALVDVHLVDDERAQIEPCEAVLGADPDGRVVGAEQRRDEVGVEARMCGELADGAAARGRQHVEAAAGRGQPDAVRGVLADALDVLAAQAVDVVGVVAVGHIVVWVGNQPVGVEAQQAVVACYPDVALAVLTDVAQIRKAAAVGKEVSEDEAVGRRHRQVEPAAEGGYPDAAAGVAPDGEDVVVAERVAVELTKWASSTKRSGS